MTRSTCMTLLSFSVAVFCYVTHRDISANIFMATVFIIQGLKQHPVGYSRQWDRIILMCTILSVAILVLSATMYFTGMQLPRPRSW